MEYKLYLGDCLEQMNNIEDKSVDLIICDLPYGTTQCSWDIIIPFEELWKQYNRVIKEKGGGYNLIWSRAFLLLFTIK